jgi:predicted RNA-binding protein
MEKDGSEELLFEDVTSINVEDETVTVSTLFEGPKELSNTVVRSIDFMAGRVLLETIG